MDQELQRDAQKMDEKVSDELEVPVCATRLDLVKLECSFKSVMRSKSHMKIINFI